MFSHYDRQKEHYGNENIDVLKTHLNYNLAVHQEMEQGAFVKQRCSEVRMQNRKDVNVMCAWVVTAPKDLQEDEHKQFFEETYNFLENRYGKDNVISAWVHNDDIIPHANLIKLFGAVLFTIAALSVSILLKKSIQVVLLLLTTILASIFLHTEWFPLSDMINGLVF